MLPRLISQQMSTYGLCLDKLLLCSLVLFLDANILLVENEHALFDVLWHVFPRQ